MPQALKWYAITILFESEIAGIQSIRPLCEERVVLFQAGNAAAARAAARRYANKAEHSYHNDKGETVQWRFAKIDRLDEIETPMSTGWEVASRFVRRHRTKLYSA